MENILDSLEAWVRGLAVVPGLLVILLPLARVWASRRARRGRATGAGALLPRWPAVFALAVAYLAAGVLLWEPLPLKLPAGLRGALLLAGSALYFPGIGLYAWGFRALGAMFGVSSGMAAQLYEGHRLVERGPYAIVRHPMYLGVMLAALGALLIFRTWAMVLYTPTAFVTLLRARREEQLLAAEFGEAWARYAERVPAWIPKIGKRDGAG